MHTLITTVELDLRIGKETMPTRVELFKHINTPSLYRWRVWQIESFRITPTHSFAKSETENLSDESLMLERSWRIHELPQDFPADNDQHALQTCLTSLQKEFTEQGISLAE